MACLLGGMYVFMHDVVLVPAVPVAKCQWK